MKDLLLRLKVLSQLSFKQAFLLIAGFIIGKIRGQNPLFISKDIFVMGDQMSYLLEKKNLIEKAGNLNLIIIKENSLFTNLEIYLRRMTTDYNIHGQIFRALEYQPLVDIVKKFANKKIQYIIDAGANVGCSTLYFKRNYPDAKVIAIEPEKGNFGLLKKNIDINHYNDVVPVKAGLWVDNSDLQITTDFRDGREYAFSLKPVKSEKVKNETVKGITINDIIAQYSFPYIDILKIDIEGAEKYLLEDETNAYNTLSKVNFLALEIHDEVADRKLVIASLTKLGFILKNFHETLVAYRKQLV